MKFSFIVPVYNVAPYLRECVDSLLDQDMPADECEIVAVNDGSTDESPAILREYEAAHPGRFVIIDQPNAGLGPARNAGLARACGEYVWFIDSDDTVRRRSLPVFAKALDAEKPDVLCVGFATFRDAVKVFDEEIVVTPSTPAEAMCCHHCMAWNKVFSREFLLRTKLAYPAVRCPEDTAETYRVLAQARKALKADAVCYNYRQRPGSIVRTFSERAMSDMVRVFRELGDLPSAFPNMRVELEYCFWKALRWQIAHLEESMKNASAEARAAIAKHMPEFEKMFAAAEIRANICICLDDWLTRYFEGTIKEKEADLKNMRDALDRSVSMKLTAPLRRLVNLFAKKK